MGDTYYINQMPLKNFYESIVKSAPKVCKNLTIHNGVEFGIYNTDKFFMEIRDLSNRRSIRVDYNEIYGRLCYAYHMDPGKLTQKITPKEILCLFRVLNDLIKSGKL